MPLFPTSPFWMACDEMFEGRSGVPFDWGGNRTYERSYKVIVRMKEMQAWSVCLCPALPLPGSFYQVGSPFGTLEYDLLALLVRREARPAVDHDWQVWIVKDTYATQLPGGPNGIRTDNPLASSNDPTQELADVSWSFETKDEAPPFDLDGQPFTTTACSPFSPPFHAPVDYPVLNISRNELSFNHQKASKFARALNNAEFLGAPPGCVQSMPATSVQKNRGVLRYQRTSYKLAFRPQQKFGGYILPKMRLMAYEEFPEGSGEFKWVQYPGVDGLGDPAISDSWQPTLLMKGQLRLGTATLTRDNNFQGDMAGVIGRAIPIWRHGHQVTQDMMLDNIGQPIDPVQIPNEVATILPWYKRFRYYRSININELLVNGVG